MVECQQSRSLRLLRKAFFKPRRTILTEASAVTIDLERIEHQHPHRMLFNRILKKAGRPRDLRKNIEKGSAAVVIPQAEVSRNRVVPERALQLAVGIAVFPPVGQVPGEKEKVRAGLDRE